MVSDAPSKDYNSGGAEEKFEAPSFLFRRKLVVVDVVLCCVVIRMCVCVCVCVCV